jgi:hypothetical protein
MHRRRDPFNAFHTILHYVHGYESEGEADFRGLADLKYSAQCRSQVIGPNIGKDSDMALSAAYCIMYSEWR